jgi:hypothetical protein
MGVRKLGSKKILVLLDKILGKNRLVAEILYQGGVSGRN